MERREWKQEHKQNKHKTSRFHIYTVLDRIIQLNVAVRETVPSRLQSAVVVVVILFFLENGCSYREAAELCLSRTALKRMIRQGASTPNKPISMRGLD